MNPPPLSRRGRRLRHLLLFFSATLLVLRQHCAAAQLNDDALGLIVFKSDLIDDQNQLSSWSDQNSDPPCLWRGITCDPQTARVSSVDISGLSLSGRLGRGLSNLAFLRRLSISDNQISGTLSDSAPDLSSLPILQRLDLSRNLLSGPLPPSLFRSPSLRRLDLSDNHLSGAVPAEVFSLAAASGSLRRLSLAGNSLVGPIPDTVGLCGRLLALDLSRNRISGAVPSSFAAMSRLSELDLSYNALSGDSLPLFPATLVDLRLQSNQLSADIADAAGGIGAAVLLQNFDLSSNAIASTLPSWIDRLPALRRLNLSNNAIQGSIPASFAALQALQSLDLSSNRLAGAIPPGLVAIPSIASLNLRHNRLSGDLPANLFCGGGALESVDISDNVISGSVPSTGCGGAAAAASPIGYMNLSYNRLTSAVGVRPSAAIVVLDLSHNQLSGEISGLDFGGAARLTVLRLHDNNLSGSIPVSLLNCSLLSEINLSQNHLTGGIPPQLGNLTDLVALDLSYNNLSGGVPAELDWLRRLAMFNVSYNWLKGMIPEGAVLGKFNGSAYEGNQGLCGPQVGVECSGTDKGMEMPKPAVLGPGIMGAMAMGKLLSSTAILAMAAAAAILAGLAAALLLNRYYSRNTKGVLEELTPKSYTSQSFSTSSGSSFTASSNGRGELVMFGGAAGQGGPPLTSTSVRGMLGKDGDLELGPVGRTYKAVMADGRTVVVKKSFPLTRSHFQREVNALAKISHPNLLTLLGYYWSPNLQLLIYEFVPMGNLHNLLHSGVGPPLDWPSRLKIALGIAQGLAHLHHSLDPPIIHYSLKSNNILLDEHSNPKISDHGLATKLLGKRHLALGGMLGYMAPELASRSSNIGEKYDVYGFGVILLELATGRLPIEYKDDNDVLILSDYVRALLEEGRAMSCVDPRMPFAPQVQAMPFLKLGLICTSQVPSNRPSMREVVQILELIQSSGEER